jgi:protein ImuB
LAASVIRMRFDLEPAFEKAIEAKKEIVRVKNLPGVFERELQLPVPIRDAKMLLKLARLRLQANPPDAPIVKIGITAEAARPRVTQNGLFLPSFPDAEKLELTIARIANVVGETNVGVAERMDTYRSGAFQVKKFVVAEEQDDCRLSKMEEQKQTSMSCRVFRPALVATVELEEGRPVRAFFAGMRGEVTVAAGPWKTSGEWWREDAWQQEEWDLELEFRAGRRQSERGLYRVYYDAKCNGWFVRGVYD